MIAFPLTSLSVAVTVAVAVAPDVPSATLTSAVDTVGGASLSLIVTVPMPSKIVTFTSLLRFTSNVSLSSSLVSPPMVRATVLEV